MTPLKGVRYWPILLQKSPRGSCRIRIRSTRIGTNGFLNLRCLFVLDLESILRAWMSKILLQQNRPDSEVAERPDDFRFLGYSGLVVLTASLSESDPLRSFWRLLNWRGSVLRVGQGTETVIVRALLGIAGASQYCDLNQCIASDTYGQWKVFNSS